LKVARLDTGWHAHPKLLKLGLAAMGLHAWSISYCDYVRSDGFIPTGAWPSVPGVRTAVQTLETAGLWEPVTDGYRLHDYTDWNRTKAQIEADQADARGRQRKHREPLSHVTEGVTNGERTPEITRDFGRNPRAPYPGPGPGAALQAASRTPYPLSQNPDGGPNEAAPRAASPAQALATLYGPPPQPPERLPNGAQQCPLCPDIFTGTYAEHLESPRHKIHEQPADLSGFHA
jgi:hypothetical protein